VLCTQPGGGCDLILVPTANTAAVNCSVTTPQRALENLAFCAYVNRAGGASRCL
jgi:predicted amidohydrolase